MALIDDVYRSLMGAGHRPNDIALYEITDIGLMFDAVDRPDPTAVAEQSYLARQRGERMTPKPAALTDEVRAALEAKRRADRDET